MSWFRWDSIDFYKFAVYSLVKAVSQRLQFLKTVAFFFALYAGKMQFSLSELPLLEPWAGPIVPLKGSHLKFEGQSRCEKQVLLPPTTPSPTDSLTDRRVGREG